MKPQKTKPPYTIPGNVCYILRMNAALAPKMLACSLASIPFAVAVALLSNFMAAEAVRLVTDGVAHGDPLPYLKFLLGAGLLFLALQLGKRMLDNFQTHYQYVYRSRFRAKIVAKALRTDYSYLESEAGQNQLQKAIEGVTYDGAAGQEALKNIVTLASNLLGLVSYSAILYTFSPWVMVLLFLLSLASFFSSSYYNYFCIRQHDETMRYQRKASYLFERPKDFAYAKEFRLYDVMKWFRAVFDRHQDGYRQLYHRSGRVRMLTECIGALIALIRNSVAYGLLILRIYQGELAPADFLWYFTIITQYAGFLFGAANGLLRLQEQSLYFSEVRSYLDHPSDPAPGGADVPSETASIEFADVSFKYPGAEEYALKNISFKLPKGGKLAIVGANGAGKTTLVKLLCGLYTDYEGKILVDGRDIRTFDRAQYFRYLAAVFQDITVLPESIRDNILCAADNTDEAALERAVALAGLDEKLKTLPAGMETPLVKSVMDGAVDLSGGEMQKFALARALYKGGKILVLDEPTAALDPIAEDRMYQTYATLTAGNTAVFISHRLSSTRFCDTILVLNDGEIIQRGTHDALLAAGGQYAAMFRAQSKYYQKEVAI